MSELYKTVYVTNQYSNSVSEYQLFENGYLSAGSVTVDAGGGPFAVAVSGSADNRSAYVTNRDSDTVSQYDVAPTGILTPKSPASVAAGEAPFGVAVTPNGKSIYVTNPGSNTVSQYTAGAGGALVPKSPATVRTGPTPLGVVTSPDGRSVYVALQGLDIVAQYDVDAGTGALSPKRPGGVWAGGPPTGVAVSPDGNSVYVTNLEDGTVSQYDVGAGRVLVPKSPATVAAGVFPFAVAITRDFHFGRAISVAARPVRVNPAGVAAIRVTCPTRRDICRLRVALRRVRSAAVIGRARARLRGGHTGRVRVRLSKKAFRTLERRHRMTVKVTVRGLHAAGSRSQRTVTLTLLAPRKGHASRAPGLHPGSGRSHVVRH